jgi:DNA-binding IclR family transcriptional regulator
MPNGVVRAAAPLSVTRVPQILRTLSAAGVPVSLAQLSRALSVPKSSLNNLLRGLVDTSFVVFSEGTYQLGPAAFDLGSALVDARRRFHMPDTIRAGMRDLSHQAHETVLFAVLNNDDQTTMTYVDIVESRNAIRISVTIGDRRALYCTAGGRILLADKSDEEVRHYLDTVKLDKLNSSTEVNKAKLLKSVQRARKELVCLVSDELVQGVSGIAAPIRDSSGTGLGALIVAVPTRPANKSAGLISLVCEAAQTISRNLGYRSAAD